MARSTARKSERTTTPPTTPPEARSPQVPQATGTTRGRTQTDSRARSYLGGWTRRLAPSSRGAPLRPTLGPSLWRNVPTHDRARRTTECTRPTLPNTPGIRAKWVRTQRTQRTRDDGSETCPARHPHTKHRGHQTRSMARHSARLGHVHSDMPWPPATVTLSLPRSCAAHERDQDASACASCVVPITGGPRRRGSHLRTDKQRPPRRR
jgi:hypothetical protein